MAFTTATAQTKVTVFSNPTTFHGTSAYTRIPSIARLNDGTLLAITDARYNNGQDLGQGYDNPNRIDLFGKTSSDNGASWSSNILDVMVRTNNETGFGYAHGDAASVVDRETGKIMVMAASGEHGFFGNGLYPLVGRAFSTDGGNSWDKTDISTKLYQSSSSVGHLFFSSGRMIQSTKVKVGDYYRVYAAVDTRSGGSRVVYSDDFGETWNYLGGIVSTPASSGDECKVEELPNGNILLSCRTQSGTGRYFNIFTFTNTNQATGNWGTVSQSGGYNTSGQTYATSCNAEVLLVPAKRISDSKQLYVLLQSAAMSKNRENVGIYYKVLENEADYDQPSDFVSGWSKYQVSTTTSCYSTMVLDQNGNIAFYYEENNVEHNGGTFDMQFKSLPLSTITGGAYEYCAPAAGSYIPTSDPSWGKTPVVSISTPTFSVAAGEYTGAQHVTISCATEGTTIYYTTDGTEPTEQSTKYDAPITISKTTTLQAIAIDGEGNKSKVATANYTIYAPTIAVPDFSVAPGTYSDAQTVALHCATTGTTVYYTLDGTTPSEKSTEYTAPIIIDKTTTLKAIAIDGEGNASKVATANYRILVSDNLLGKTGTTIIFNKESSHPLYSEGAQSTDNTKQPFSFLRHDIAHVQVVSSNSSTVNATGNFAENNNNMLFEGDALTLSTSSNRGCTSAYIAVIAPKGYRFIRYQMNGIKSAKDATLTQYSTDNTNINSKSVGTSLDNWDVTLNDGTNVLYFKYDPNALSTKLSIQSLKLTYAIDQPFEAALPNSDASASIQTGVLDPGQFSYNGNKKVWSFKENAITDTQDASIYHGSKKEAQPTATLDGVNYFAATGDGDYYVEAPEKFRIVGATLQLVSTNSAEPVNAIVSGAQYVLTDGKGNFLNKSGNGFTNGKDLSSATRWTITETSDGKYTIQNGNNVYVGHSDKALSHNLANTNSTWAWDKDNGFHYENRALNCYLRLKDSKWEVSEAPLLSNPPSNLAIPAVGSANFTATPYTRDNQPMAAVTVNEKKEVALEDFNNDAIHFNIKGLPAGYSALYAVNLELLPLNPELQNLSVASKLGDGTEINNTSFSAENYLFNGGKEVTLLIPSNEDNCSVVFKNAYNEERTQWYTEGTQENNTASKGGYSNYFLVNAPADKGGNNDVTLNTTATPSPAARTKAEQAGTAQLLFTNIDKIYTVTGTTFAGGDSYLKDNDFKKQDAHYGKATLTPNDECKTFYIYVADQPTWSILPAEANAKHIDFRYFTLNLCCEKESEKAYVTLTPLYTSTLKSANHKNSGIASDGNTLDTQHTFYGVTVKAQMQDETILDKGGKLTSKEVVAAIKTALLGVNYGGFGATDPYRGVLYIDMSALAHVDEEAFTDEFHKSTADNCLYFMYEGFHRDNIENTIAATDNGYEAVGNIIVYDQQPFFTPYDFTTGTYTVSYTREQTAADGSNTLALVKNMTVVLPFDVQLNENGNLKTASDAVNNTVTYHNLTGQDGVPTCVRKGDGGELTYGILAEEVKDGVAHANQPYYVTSTTPGFTYNILGAKFTKSGEVNGESVTLAELTRTTNNVWKGIGTYCGETPKKSPLLWYFSKDLFWKSSNLKNYDVVYARPFRAYFTTTEEAAGTKASVAFDPNDLEPTGISDINAGKAGLQIVAGRGGLAVSSDADTTVRVFTIAGQLVANEDITAGETLRMSVPQGVYLVNGTKVVVR